MQGDRHQRYKIFKNPQHQELLSIFLKSLPTFTPMVTVGLMKTSQTLILMRQHRCLSLVSARLPS
jgi:hypothetical protein